MEQLKEHLKVIGESVDGGTTTCDSQDPLVVWKTVLETIQKFVTSSNGANKKYDDAQGRCYKVFYKLPDDFKQQNPKLVDACFPWFSKTLESAKSVDALYRWADAAVNFMMKENKDLKPVTFPDKWIPVLYALLRWPHKDLNCVAKDLITNKTFAQAWNWKDNYEKGVKCLEIMGKAFLKRKTADSKYMKDFVEGLTNGLKYHKKSKFLNGPLMVLILDLVETRNIKLIQLAEGMTPYELVLQETKEMVPALLKRILTIITNVEKPLPDHADVERWASKYMLIILQNYKNAKSIPEDVQKYLTTIFRYSIELPNHEDKYLFKGLATQPIYTYVNKCQEGRRPEMLKPIMHGVLKHLTSDGYFYTVAEYVVSVLSNLYGGKALAAAFPLLVEWYASGADDPSTAIMSVMSAYSYGDMKGMKRTTFDRLYGLYNEEEDPSVLQCTMLLFNAIAKKQPNLIVYHLDELITKCMADEDRFHAGQILIMCKEVSLYYPDAFGEVFIKEIVNGENVPSDLYMYAAQIGTAAAHAQPKLHKRIYKGLLDRMKTMDDDTHMMFVIEALRSIGSKFGVEIFKPDRPLFEKLKKKTTSSYNVDSINAILGAMDGNTLEIVAIEVKKLQDDVLALDDRVTGTEADIKGLKVKAEEQDEEIMTVILGLVDINERVDEVEDDLEEMDDQVEILDTKMLSNVPKWSKDVTKLMNPKAEHDWRLLASRLGYSNDDIKAWAQQSDPCMSLLNEWYATNRTREANHGMFNALVEMNRLDAASIMENALKAVEDVVEDDEVFSKPPAVFLSYQWGHQQEVMLLRQHLQKAGYECWMDIGQMGGGDKLFEKIDNGIRGAKVIICCVSEKYSSSPNCNREVNLSVNLGKPMIPLLMEKMSWPPKGSMGPIFSEYLFVRFFTRSGEEAKDNRYWPVPKFEEMLMQLNIYQVLPDNSLVEEEYKDWWKQNATPVKVNKDIKMTNSDSPDIFLSYQWGKQPQIKALYKKLTEMGFTCWMDIYQMGGGDSLYDKIDRGVRGCRVVVTMVTSKYALSANCRREVSLCDSLQKPVIPLLLEDTDWPPAGPMSMVFTQLEYIDCTEESLQEDWEGQEFQELLEKIVELAPSLKHLVKTEQEDENEIENEKEEELDYSNIHPPMDNSNHQQQNQQQNSQFQQQNPYYQQQNSQYQQQNQQFQQQNQQFQQQSQQYQQHYQPQQQQAYPTASQPTYANQGHGNQGYQQVQPKEQKSSSCNLL